MQDPHISRSFKRVFQLIGLGCIVGVSKDTNLKRNHIEKTVMFENAEKTNADIAKDKKTVYRYHRLSKEDKAELYRLRPDLNTKGRDSLISNESYETSSSNNSSFHEPLLLRHTVSQMERERSIQAQSKRDRVRELSDAISIDSTDKKNYHALKNIDGKIIKKSELSQSHNPYYDSDSNSNKDNFSTGDSSTGSNYSPPNEFTVNSNHITTTNPIQVSPLNKKDYDIESSPDEKRINSLKRVTNLSTSTPLQVDSSKFRFPGYDESNPYTINEPYEIDSESNQEPIKSPNTIVSDESIFAPDCDMSSDDSSSDEDDEDNDESNRSSNNSSQKPDDLVGNFLSWMF